MAGPALEGGGTAAIPPLEVATGVVVHGGDGVVSLSVTRGWDKVPGDALLIGVIAESLLGNVAMYEPVIPVPHAAVPSDEASAALSGVASVESELPVCAVLRGSVSGAVALGVRD
jgi:hypothetical protein